MAMMSVFTLFCLITSAFAVEIFVSNGTVRSGREIWRCPEDTLQACSRIPVTGLRYVSGIDIDPAAGYLYWADRDNRTISRTQLTGADQKVLFRDVESFGIRLDVQSGQIFWTDYDKGTIERGDISGSNRAVIVSGLFYPYAIALDPTATPPLVYWTATGSGRIERADYNGGSRQQLVSGLSYPVGLALDTARRLMYWTDTLTDRVEVAGLDGSNRTTLRNVSHSYTSMDYFGDQLYLADNSKGTLERYSTLSTSTVNAPVVVRRISNIYRVRVVGELSYTTPATPTTPTTTSATLPMTTAFTPKISSSTETTSAAATTKTSSVTINLTIIIGISVAGAVVIIISITITIGVVVAKIYRRRRRDRQLPRPLPEASSSHNDQYMTTSFINTQDEVSMTNTRKRADIYYGVAPLTKDYLCNLAHQLGEEWRDVADILGLKHSQVQTILKNNQEDPGEADVNIKLDMLKAWHMTSTKDSKQVDHLINTLRTVNRHDLADDLQKKNDPQNPDMARKKKFEDAVTGIAHDQTALDGWRKILEELGLESDLLDAIAQQHSSNGNRKCLLEGIMAWVDKKGRMAQMKTLANVLVQLKHTIAKEKISHLLP